MKKLFWLGTFLLGTTLITGTARADHHLFTYTYEPETEPKGDREYEQSVTLRAGRNAAVGQRDFSQWEFRHEFEYGVTENYTAALYLNHTLQHFRDPATGAKTTRYDWAGISLENRYLVLDPANHAVGLTLYLEPTYAGKSAELEQKIILGQRCGDWKWAVNLTHATEWTDYFRGTEGELEISASLARQLNRRWSVGIEIRDHNELPDYKSWENTVLYLGPVVSYRRSGWWAALTVMPQIYGANFTGDPDGNHHLELEGHERINVRLLFGFSF